VIARGCRAIPVLTALLAACGQASGGSSAPAPTIAGLRIVADVPLGGSTGRLDYQSLDAANHRLYIARLGEDEVAVVDTATQGVIANIADVPGAHGVLAVPELGRVYAAATDRNEVAVIDTQTLRVVASVAGGDFPDGLAYDPVDHRVFVSDEHGGTDTVIDATDNRRIESVDVGGDVGNSQYDPSAHLVVVAVGSANQVVVIDPARDVVVHRYDLPGCEGAHGVHVDDPTQVAYVACERNAKLLALDLRTGRASPTEGVGDVPDVLAYDPGLHRLYVAAESGTMAVFQTDGMRLRRVAVGFAGPDAHTVAVDPATHRVFLPLADDNGRPVLRVMAPEGR
jgi:YVTN family beta-propeller protein